MHKFIFSGMNGAGKSTTTRAVANILAQKGYTILFLDESSQEQKAQDKTYCIMKGITKKAVGEKILSHVRTCVKLCLIALQMFIHVCIERYARYRFKPDIIISDRDIFPDALVYASYFLKSSWSLRLPTLSRHTSIFYLDLDPMIAKQRVIARGRGMDVSLEKLTALQGMYRRILSNRKNVYVIDSTMELNALVQKIVAHIESFYR